MKKVLIVDDCRVMRRLVAAVLGGAGYQVVEAEDGVAGLAQIHALSDLSLVICDIHMPGLDGVGMIEEFGRGVRRELPILVLSGDVDQPLMARAAQAGVKGWMVKPIQPDLLLQAVGRIVG